MVFLFWLSKEEEIEKSKVTDLLEMIMNENE